MVSLRTAAALTIIISSLVAPFALNVDADILTDGNKTVADALETPDTETTTPKPTLDKQAVAKQIHTRINEHRTAHGLDPLAYDPDIEDVAQDYASFMARTGWYNHTSPNGTNVRDRLQNAGYDCKRGDINGGAENLMLTYYDSRVNINGRSVHIDSETALANTTVELWMDSEGHRDIILDPDLDSEGIGVAIDTTTDPNTVYIVQNFC